MPSDIQNSKKIYLLRASVGVIGDSLVLDLGLEPGCSRSRERLFGLVTLDSLERLTLAASAIPARLDFSEKRNIGIAADLLSLAFRKRSNSCIAGNVYNGMNLKAVIFSTQTLLYTKHESEQ